MKKDAVTLSMAERRAEGLLWVDTGENMNQQIYARGLCQDFNRTRADETEKRERILKDLFAFLGEFRICGKINEIWNGDAFGFLIKRFHHIGYFRTQRFC